MGCQRKNIIEGEFPVGTAPTVIALVPATACEGQMTFKDVGATGIKVAIGRPKNSTDMTTQRYSLSLLSGEGFSEEGIVPGQIIALGDGAGGLLSVYISYNENQNV